MSNDQITVAATSQALPLARLPSKAQQTTPNVNAGVTASVSVWKRKPWKVGIMAINRINVQRTGVMIRNTTSTSQSKATEQAKSRHCRMIRTCKAFGADRNNLGRRYHNR